MLLKERIQRELDRIREQNGGGLSAQAVVDFARDPRSALHSQFTWDDGEAAEKWRLHQARNVMRLVVTTLPGCDEPVRALVSLTSDRRLGVGYRALVDVLDDEAMHAQMLADALAELRVFRGKYQRLRELRPLWEAVETIENATAGDIQPAA